MLKRSGLLTHRYGPPLQIGVTRAISGYADVSDLNLRRLQLGLAPDVTAGQEEFKLAA